VITKVFQILEEMNKLNQGALILLVACVEYGDYYACSKSNITWNGQVYTSADLAIEEFNESADKQAPEVTIHFSNLGGMAENRVVENDEYKESWIDIYFVNSKLLDLTDPVYYIRLQCQKVTCTREIVSFTLGLDNPLLQLYPSRRFHNSICQYKPYEIDICDKAAICGQTITDCIAWGNDSNGNPYTERLGAQPGLSGAIQDEEGL
jgi:phage-related protein